MQRRYLGKWELGALVFHSCITRLFTSYPGQIDAVSNGAGWLSVLFCGLVFLAGLGILLRFLPTKPPSVLWTLLSIVYWVVAAVYTLKEGSGVLQQVSYFHSPDWFLMLFLLLGAIAPALGGARSVFRMHSLLVLPIGLTLLAVGLFGLGNASLTNLFPLLGSGASAVFGKGLLALGFYPDLLFLAVLFPRCRPEVPVKRTIFFSSALAVLFHIGLMLISSLREPYEITPARSIPLHSMAKAGVGLEALYLLGLLLSATLYLSLALYMIAFGIKRLRKTPQMATAILCLILCIGLCGCYDSREVEESAYLIALGVDKGTDAPYCYTFQISNPLEMGTTQEKEEEPTEKKEPNKGVNNLFFEAESFPLALSQLRSYLGKEPDISHLKLILFSKELAKEGIGDHAAKFLGEPEIRPDTKLCLADSAQEFLVGVKPTLEQSTARYYALLFRQRYSPDAPVTELSTFVSDCQSTGKDPVLPLAEKDRISGMGMFQDGRLRLEASAEDAMFYKMLCAEANNITVPAGESIFQVSSRSTPKIVSHPNQDPPRIEVTVTLSANLHSGTEKDLPLLAAKLEEGMTRLLRQGAALSLDPLGIGNTARKSYLTQTEWESMDWENQLQKSLVFTKTILKKDKITSFLQKN
ncbi:MAG: GerAB/ArcD/ProY family transporter [Clostridia bacterium]|nr:GerAB/ArcD/ProY family transporter [Clostridia bacterium]